MFFRCIFFHNWAAFIDYLPGDMYIYALQGCLSFLFRGFGVNVVVTKNRIYLSFCTVLEQ